MRLEVNTLLYKGKAGARCNLEDGYVVTHIRPAQVTPYMTRRKDETEGNDMK